MVTLASKIASYRDSIGKPLILAMAAASATMLPLPSPAAAAPVGAVIAACDRTPGCDYSADDKGWIYGCSSTQSGVCFKCDPGKGQCTQINRTSGPGKKTTKVPNLVKGIVGVAGKPIKSVRPAPGIAPTMAGNAAAGDQPRGVKPRLVTGMPPSAASNNPTPVTQPKLPLASSNRQGATGRGGHRR